MKPDEIQKERDGLNALVLRFNHKWTELENSMADLLHHVLFCNMPVTMWPGESRIAHAIYFSPEGFGQRQVIVNNAITEWLVENPIGTYDFLPLWNEINKTLGTLRGTRNLIAHGSVNSIRMRSKLYIRVMPPGLAPKMAHRVAKGSLPGKSLAEMQQAEGGLTAMLPCIGGMTRVLWDHEAGEPTWQQRFDALTEHLNQLSKWFPDPQKIQGC
jgi:hypothetical protein